MKKDQAKETLYRVKKNLRVTKVVATRSVKTNRGDFFSGFSSAWDSVQDDAGSSGADMDLVMTSGEVSQSGMTLQDARIAHNLLALQADIAAYEAAYANGAISSQEKNDAIRAVKNNYAVLIKNALVNGDLSDSE